jgi:cellobiose phosphorylase
MATIEQFGRFIDEEGCFLLTDNDPPRKWTNVHYNRIGEDEIYCEVTNLGDGTTYVRDKDGVTVTLVGWDCSYVYIRDEDSGTVFCPAGAPAPAVVTDFACRYHAASTEISGTCEGLRATQRIFVPRDLPVEVWTVTVENLTDRPRRLSVFAYAMFQLSGCDAEGGYVGKDNYSEVIPEIGGVLVTNRNRWCPTDRFKGYLVALEGFAGGSGYRDFFLRSEFAVGTPRILWGWNADNRNGFGPDCAGAVQVSVEVAPGGTGRADFVLGQARSADEVAKVRGGLSPEALDEMCAEQTAVEAARASTFLVRTGDPNYDGLMNHFVKKQMYSYLINKSGFRDNLQLDNALCMVDYEAAEQNLLRALSSQYANGSVPHGFRPLNRLQYADKPAWTMLAIPGLIKESGRVALLEEEVPYFESDEVGTVWDHMLRAMRFLAGDLGQNGLCNQHHADWNDGLEATPESGERESVMVTQQLCYGLREVEELARMIGETEVEAECRQRYDEFARRLNDVAWDGEWYVRTICGDGYRIGSKNNKEGSIYLNAQSWAVLSGIAPDERAQLCMQGVDRHLETDVGYRICNPPYTEYDPRVGRMSNSIPGHVENGGCYNHAAGFKGVADCVLGRAEQAWRTWVKVAPDNPQNPVTVSTVEPFCFTNSYSLSRYAYGKAGNPMRTGTAAWLTILLVEWVLGARRSYEGLLIDPCLTKGIEHAGVVRTFRGARYDIELDNSAGRCKGATSIKMDGQTVEGNVLPVLEGGEHKVEVVI